MSTPTEPASAPTSTPALVAVAITGIAMFIVGLVIGTLVIAPQLSRNTANLPPSVPTRAAQTTPLPTPTSTATATPPPPTATAVPPTATPLPPTATPPPPTMTPTPQPTPTTAHSASIFAPEATEQPKASQTATAPGATSGPILPTTASTTPASDPTATVAAPLPTFAATDRVATEIPVNFRAGPGTTYTVQGALSPGTLLAATGQQQTTDNVLWRQFRLANGTLGWVRAQDVLPAP